MHGFGQRLKASGQRIGPYGRIVAAAAVEGGSAVATFERRHFAPVKGSEGERSGAGPARAVSAHGL
jgi:predicted nucleic acid-binding protein